MTKEDRRNGFAPGKAEGGDGHAAGVVPGSVDEERGPVGIFPSWKWLYGTVLVYGTLMIIALWILTRVLDLAS